MSKFFEALERAEKERARHVSTTKPAAGEPTGVPPDGLAPGSREVLPGVDRPRDAAETLESENHSAAVDDLAERIDDHLIGLLAPNAPEAEHYRRLCQLIREQKQSAGLSAIAISSPGVADGKTTTAINVAGLLAHDPQHRVLLLEVDLRAPSVASQLGLATRHRRGLADVLTGSSVTLESVMVQYQPLNLRIIPAGDAFGHPYDLISSPRFGELLTRVRSQFDYVIVDAPPLTPFPDCRIIASCVDALIVVVGANRTPRRLLEEGLSTVDPTKILGLLFNGADGFSLEYPGRRYGRRDHDTRTHSPHRHRARRRSWLFGRRADER